MHIYSSLYDVSPEFLLMARGHRCTSMVAKKKTSHKTQLVPVVTMSKSDRIGRAFSLTVEHLAGETETETSLIRHSSYSGVGCVANADN